MACPCSASGIVLLRGVGQHSEPGKLKLGDDCAAQASMLTQLVKGKDVKGRMPFDLDDLVQHRGRLGEERLEVHRFVRDLRVPDKTYQQQVDDLDSKIARLKRQARLKKAATSSTIVHSSGAGHWGQAYFVGAQTQRPHWY